MKKWKLSPFFIGFLQALAVFVYCVLVALFIRNVEHWFGKGFDPFLGIIIFLLLFCTSALICALLVGAYPAYIYFADSRENLKRALSVLISSGIWLLIFFIIYIAILAIIL